MAADQAIVVDIVAGLEPSLPRELIAALVAELAPSASTAHRLMTYLRASPEALTSGFSAAPAPVRQLAVRLVAAGAQQVSAPRCVDCDQAAGLPHRAANGRLCAACYQQRRSVPCVRCGQRRPIRGRTADGAPLCGACRHHQPGRLQACSNCGQHRRVNARTEAGQPLCSTCYQPPAVVCGDCGQTAPAASRHGGRALCARCYQRPRRPCGRCGRTRIVHRRATETSPDLCRSCAQWPIATCHRCARQGPCRGLRQGQPLCLDCELHDRVDELLAGPDGTIQAPLVRLRDAVLGGENPLTALNWLKSSPAVTVLRQLASGERPLTHEALSDVPRNPAIDHLRQLLIAAGALPDRNAHLARLEQSAVQLAASLEHLEDQRLLRAFATWRILWRLRRQEERSTVTPHAVAAARGILAENARFLAWLRAQGASPATCQQAHIDHWLAGATQARSRIRDLVVWAHTRRQFADVTVPARTPSGTASGTPRTIGDAARWRLTRRLLHDDGLDVVDRVAGALVVLYAQPVARIARLTAADLTDTGEELVLCLGRDGIVLPEPLASLVRQLRGRQQAGMAGRITDSSTWLFPGRQADRPLHPEHLRRRLAALGVDRAVGRAALLQLATELAPVVLADLLNLHPSTAVRWARIAGGDWARYAADRSRSRA